MRCYARLFLLAGSLLFMSWEETRAQSLFSFHVGQGFSQPLFATSAPGQPDTLYVVQKGGLIRTLDVTPGGGINNPGITFGNIATAGINFTSSGGEQGLLGMAFHPNYAGTGPGANTVFVSYTTSNNLLRVDRFTVSGGTIDASSRQAVIAINRPASNHNGGWLGFSPNDGYLYISSGDSGGGNDPGNLAQNRGSLNGKMLRIDINSSTGPYSIPATNPVNTDSSFAPEVWSYGLRNPWRPSFDRQTGDLWIADVGQGAREEINFQAASAPGGANYGWRLREGTIATPTAGIGGPRPADNVDPILDYPRSIGGSITGGYVSRGGDISDGNLWLDGSYFYGDYVSGRIFTLRYDGNTVTSVIERTSQLNTPINNAGAAINTFDLASFAEDGAGRLYMIDITLGNVLRIQGAAVPEPSTLALLGGTLAGGAWVVYRHRKNSRRDREIPLV
ncbi:MAG TPA: PQQ-dependent sugar dehydrogenase [Gemmatales bacterium]|nr:PQQ-dependent sugar dehydrogenase [Gemmatales bacterium]